MQQPDYAKFMQAVAQARSPHDAFEALCALTTAAVGAKLFTIMVRDPVTGSSGRIYSNMPDAYPPSGTKPINRTRWSTVVVEEKRTFVANDIEAIATVFSDHALIKSLGCESVINVPVIVGGEVKGTINCLHEKDFYTPERVRAAEALKLPGAVCMLLNELDEKEGK